MEKSFRKGKYEGLKSEELTNIKESEFGIQNNPEFESARYILLEGEFDIATIYQKLLTRGKRTHDPEFKIYGGTNGGGVQSHKIGAIFRKIRGYTKDYMVNAINFRNQKPHYLQIETWIRPQEKQTKNETRRIDSKNVKLDLERILDIELPKPKQTKI